MKSYGKLEIDLNSKDTNGKTAFQLACEYGHYEVAKRIINKSKQMKIDLNAKELCSHTAFHLACFYNKPRVAELLVNNSYKHKIDLNSKNVNMGMHLFLHN